MIPERPRIEWSAPTDSDDKKSKRTWSGPRYSNSTGGASTPLNNKSLTYLNGRVHVHEPPADVAHEREAPAM